MADSSTAPHTFDRDLGFTAEATVHLPKLIWRSIFGSSTQLSKGETVEGISYKMEIQNETCLNL